MMRERNYEDAMTLPDGKTCADCIHYHRCSWLCGLPPENTRCDWYPNYFRPLKEGGVE